MSVELENLKNLHAPSHIFTFCNDSVYAHCYVEIKVEGYYEARAIMINNFNTNWGFQYSSKEAAGVYKFELRKIGLDGKDIVK